jgi:tripartite ATP-independent transporter DctM subunit
MVVIRLGANANNLPAAERRAALIDMWREFKGSILALIMPVIILGGILGGIVTPTEAASIAVAYALFIGVFVYRNISVQDMYEMLVRTARITGVIFVIIGFATILGWWLSFNQIPQAIAAQMGAMSDNPYVIIAMIMGFLLFVGMVMDITATLIIVAPVLVPLTNSIGMDPVHAGIMIILALNISLMTPPVGACLFVLSSVTGEKLERIAMKLWPFLLAETLVMVLFSFNEDLALLLPRVFGFVDWAP